MSEGDTPTQIMAGAAKNAVFGQGYLYDLWYFAALSHDVKVGDLRRIEMLGEPVMLGRSRSGAAFALRDICPHRAAPLSAGRLTQEPGEEETVQCPYHGWRFGVGDGVCRAIPSLVEDQDVQPSRIKVRTYRVHESQGLIFIYFPDGATTAPLRSQAPLFDGVVGGRPKLVERMDLDSHIDQAVVGLMDPTHGPYVHQQWWWRSSRRQLQKAKAFEPRELGFAMAFHAPSRNSRAYRLLGGAPQTEITFRLPGYRWEHVKVGKNQVLALTCLTPITPTKTRITQIFWSDHWAFTLLKAFIRAGARRFLHQDGAMVNLQNDGLKYDPPLIWIDDADTQAKWYQALKKAWSAGRVDQNAFLNPVPPAILRWRS